MTALAVLAVLAGIAIGAAALFAVAGIALARAAGRTRPHRRPPT